MNAQLQSLPENFLSEDFEFEGHPADLEQIVEAGFIRYEQLPKSSHIRRQFRNRLNELVAQLSEMRQFNQFTYAS